MTRSPARAALAILAPMLLVACTSQPPTWTFSPPTPSPVATPGPPSPSPTAAPSPTPAHGTPQPSGSPSASPSSGPTQEARVIEIELTSAVQIHQGGQQISSLDVTQGETIHLRVTNTAGFPHNFYIGPADKLSANLVSGLPGVPDFSEGTQEFDYTVTADTVGLEFGCTFPGHYTSMHGTFAVSP